MPITVSGNAVGTLSGSTVTIARPPTSAAGDLLLVALGAYNSQPTANQSGWTVLKTLVHTGGSNAHGQYIAWRWYDPAVSSYTFNTSSTYGNGLIVAFRQVNPLTPLIGYVTSATSNTGSGTYTVPSTTSTASQSVLVAVAGGMGNNSAITTMTATSPLTLIATSQGQQYDHTGIAWQTLGNPGATGTRTMSGHIATWGTAALILQPAGFESSSAPVSFSASAEMEGGSAVHFIDASVPVTFAATQPYFANTYLSAVVPVVFDTAAYWQPGIPLDTSTDETLRPAMTFRARGNLDVIVPPVPPPSDVVFVKRVSVTMPVPTLNDRGRPVL